MDEQRVAVLIWRGKGLIALAVGAMLVVALALTFTASKSYEATTLLRVDQVAIPDNGSDAYNAQQANATQAVSYATLLNSSSFLLRVAPRIDGGARFTGPALAGDTNASAIPNTNLIAFTFTAGSRNDALHYANVVARAAIVALDADFAAERTGQQGAIQANLATVNARIAALRSVSGAAARQKEGALAVARSDLTQQYAKAFSAASTPSSVVFVTGPPSAPSDPVSPRPLTNAIIAVFLGLVIGVGLAWVRDRYRSRDERGTAASDDWSEADRSDAAGGA